MSQFHRTYSVYVFFAAMLLVASLAYNGLDRHASAQTPTESAPAREPFTPYARRASAGTVEAPKTPGQGPADARAFAEQRFLDRVNKYVGLRNRLAARQPKLEQPDDPAQIRAREQALGEAIRAARAAVRPGTIFAPAAARLRRMVRLGLRRRTLGGAASAPADRPAGVTLHVNDFYPSTLPLVPVPPNLLARLPRLPDGLEYRLAGRELILRDVAPNLVVDLLANAVPLPRR
jgi:hypothetical protein